MALHWQILLAFLLDLVLGDPRGLPHPVRAIGALAHWLESFTRTRIRNPLLAGGLTTVIVVSATGGVAWGLLAGARALDPYLETAVSIFFIYTGLSLRGLYDESVPVARALENNDLETARAQLSRIVGRDTQELDEKGVLRACVETISENTIDGIIAPMFYAFLGGASGMLMYKAVNTLDSMFGYKNETYLLFGRIPARLDDAMNWVPARLGAVIIAVVSFLGGGKPGRALAVLRRDRYRHASPNAGWPEAAMAGALGVRLGGPSRYRGVLVDKPWIGDADGEIGITHIHQAHRIMFAASLFFLVLSSGLA